MHCMRNMRDERVPSPDSMQARKRHQATSENNDARLERVGVSDRGKAADDSHAGGNRSHDPYHRHDLPTYEASQHERAGIQMKRHLRRDRNYEHEGREQRTRRGMVPSFEKLGSGEHSVANVERIKKSCRKTNGDTRREFDRSRRKPVAIRISRKPDQMFGP